MPQILAIRSIPLSRRTGRAWLRAGVAFWPRFRPLDQILDLEDEDTLILNLGNSQLPSDVAEQYTTYNPPDTVRILSSPALSRELLDSLLPPIPTGTQACWLKARGRAGNGKTFYPNGYSSRTPAGCDLQKHVEGTEYRVNTVGTRVVQVHERTLTPPNSSYQWVGVHNAPKAVKDVARRAASLAGAFTVLGHDIRHSRAGTYLLEANTCAGVNDATARRIVELLHKA